jgi:hypothetical protein
VSSTYSFHSDVSGLIAAISQIRRIAFNINEQKRIYEQKQMETELQLLLAKKYHTVCRE